VETQNPKIASFHLNDACLPFTVKMIDCMLQDVGTKHSIQQYVTITLDVYQVCHLVSCCVKNGSCSYQA